MGYNGPCRSVPDDQLGRLWRQLAEQEVDYAWWMPGCDRCHNGTAPAPPKFPRRPEVVGQLRLFPLPDRSSSELVRRVEAGIVAASREEALLNRVNDGRCGGENLWEDALDDLLYYQVLWERLMDECWVCGPGRVRLKFGFPEGELAAKRAEVNEHTQKITKMVAGAMSAALPDTEIVPASPLVIDYINAKGEPHSVIDPEVGDGR